MKLVLERPWKLGSRFNGRRRWLLRVRRRWLISSRSLSHLLISSCYRWNQFKVIPWPVDFVQETSPNYLRLRHRTLVDGISDCLSGRGLMTSSVSRRQPVTIDY